jgi:hypothetical protein
MQTPCLFVCLLVGFTVIFRQFLVVCIVTKSVNCIWIEPLLWVCCKSERCVLQALLCAFSWNPDYSLPIVLPATSLADGPSSRKCWSNISLVFAKCCVPEFETPLAFFKDTPGRRIFFIKKADSNRYWEIQSVVRRNEFGLRRIEKYCANIANPRLWRSRIL